MLIESGVDIDAKNKVGRTAAMLAAGKGHPELAALLGAVAPFPKEGSEMAEASVPSHSHPAANRPKVRI